MESRTGINYKTIKLLLSVVARLSRQSTFIRYPHISHDDPVVAYRVIVKRRDMTSRHVGDDTSDNTCLDDVSDVKKKKHF